MGEHHSEPDVYLAEHVRDALARDPRVGELDVQVTVDAERVLLTGRVPTAERREAISAVVRELLPDREVRNEIAVSAFPESSRAERLA